MRLSRLLWIGGVGLALSCGKSDQPKTAAETPKAAATADTAMTPANAPFAPTITSRGYRIVQARRFPAQLSSRRASAVVYQSADGSNGGILYTQRLPSGPDRVSWHWVFRDAAPDSIQPVAANPNPIPALPPLSMSSRRLSASFICSLQMRERASDLSIQYTRYLRLATPESSDTESNSASN